MYPYALKIAFNTLAVVGLIYSEKKQRRYSCSDIIKNDLLTKDTSILFNIQ